MLKEKRYLSLLLAMAMVVTSISLGFGGVATHAVTLATGQTIQYHIYMETHGQTCAGSGTDSSFKLRLDFDVSADWYSPVIDDTSDSNDQEPDDNNNMYVTGPAEPLSAVFLYQDNSNGGQWQWDIIRVSVNFGAGEVTIAEIAGGIYDTIGGSINLNYNGTMDNNYNRTLTWNGNGGTVNGGSTYTTTAIQGATYPNNSTNIPTSIVRTGYTFTGWSPAIPSTGPNANTTYNAQWTANIVAITFDANGGTGGSTYSKQIGSALSAPTVARSGYTFITWSPSLPSTVPAVNRTYTAIWLANGETNTNTYNIVFDPNGGSGTPPGQILTFAQTAALASNVFTKTGYTFIGWATSQALAASGIKEYFNNENYTIGSNDVVLYAVWNANSYTMTFDANGGTGGTSISLWCDSALSAPAVTKTGYTFFCWEPTVPATVPAANTTYTAQWTANTYTVTFDPQSGSVSPTSLSVTYASTYGTLPTPTRTGYTFGGWYTSTGGAGTKIDSTTTVAITAAKTLYAKWTANTYTVIYDSNGASGGTTATSSHAYGTAKALSSNGFTKTGYTFAGWATDASGPVVYSNAQSVSNLTTINGASITLFAVWTINQYTIIFDANGGIGGSNGLMTYGDVLTAPTVTKTGYTFSGWSAVIPATVPAANTTYVALWDNTYSITFDANGGSGGTIEYKNEGDTLTAPTVTKTGYTFSGWSPVLPATMPAANSTYTAQWTVNTYTVTYNGNGYTGGSTASSSHTYNTAKALTTNGFTRTGYTFAGWATSTSGSVVYSNSQSVSNLTSTNGATVTLYAKWTANTYTVAYNGNGYTGGSTASSTHTYDTAKALTANGFTKTGYTFTGWATSASGAVVYSNSQSVSNITSSSGATVTLYAKWTVSTVSITFDANGGNGGNGPTAMTPGAALATPTVTRTGYTLTGWSPAVPSTVPAVDTIYTAQWAVETYTLSLNANGGSGDIYYVIDSGSGVSVPACPFTRTGYTYSGWNTAANGSGISYTPGQLIYLTANLMLYAQWTANQYTVTFEANGGTVSPTTITVTYTSTYGTLPSPTKPGYTFGGWYIGTGGTGTNILSTTPVTITASQTLYAYWVINQIYMTWDPNGGTWWDGSTGSKTTIWPDVPIGGLTRNGCTFNGWSPTPPATQPAGPITFTAQWEVTRRYITFDANGGTGGTGPTSMTPGTALTAPTVTRTGYTFMGWSPEVPPTVPAIDTIYTALWDLNSYTVTFDANGGTGVPDARIMHYGEPLVAPTVTRTGYTFTGWSPEVPTTVPAYNITYFAQWDIDTTDCVQFTVSSSEGVSGEIVTVSIAISENSNTGAAKFELPFNPGLFEYVSATKGSALSSGMADINFDAVNNKIIMTFISADGLIAGGNILDVQLRIKNGKPPQTVITSFAVIELADSNIVPLQSTVTQGTISVKSSLGDINFDGAINTLDALMALKAASGKIILTDTQELAADVNLDGSISAVDALIILQYTSGKITGF